MPVDMCLLAEVDRWLKLTESGNGGGLGMDNLKNINHWTSLSKTASHALPRMLTSCFKYMLSMREELVKLQAEPYDLVASQQQVIALQAELLQCKNDQLQSLQATVRTSVEDTVKAEFQTYSNVAAQKNVPQQAIPHEIVKNIVKSVVQEEDRSRSFMVFNLPEAEEDEDQDQLCSKVGEVLQELGEKPKIEASRLGKPDKTKARPIKVSLSSSVAVNQILAKARSLRTSARHKAVFICHDRSPEERAQHRLLVEELKKRREDNPRTKFYIRGGVVCDGGVRKDDT
jgi:hypothetical protein